MPAAGADQEQPHHQHEPVHHEPEYHLVVDGLAARFEGVLTRDDVAAAVDAARRRSSPGRGSMTSSSCSSSAVRSTCSSSSRGSPVDGPSGPEGASPPGPRPFRCTGARGTMGRCAPCG